MWDPQISEFRSSRSFIDQEDEEGVVVGVDVGGVVVGEVKHVDFLVVGLSKKEVDIANAHYVDDVATLGDAEVLMKSFFASRVLISCFGDVEGKLWSEAWPHDERQGNMVMAPHYVSNVAAWVLQWCQVKKIPCEVRVTKRKHDTSSASLAPMYI